LNCYAAGRVRKFNSPINPERHVKRTIGKKSRNATIANRYNLPVGLHSRVQSDGVLVRVPSLNSVLTLPPIPNEGSRRTALSKTQDSRDSILSKFARFEFRLRL